MTDNLRLDARPEITQFVDRVRARLADLTDEEREELIGGLEADLAELVADGGSVGELGDPRAYADELRAAAGFGERSMHGAKALRRPSREVVTELLDNAHARWDALAARPALAGPWSFLVTLRPLWWFFRAWLAVQLLDLVSGRSGATPVPTLHGVLPGVVVLLVAVLVSVQIGRGHWWPGSAVRRSVAARGLLLVLNAFAVLVTPVVLGQFPASGTPDIDEIMDQAYSRPGPGLMNRGVYVENVFAYDATGAPLSGVQLFDQDGRPLALSTMTTTWNDDGRGEVGYPWLSGTDAKPVYNVFPLPRRVQWRYDDARHAQAWTSARPPMVPAPPLVAVPPVSLPTAQPTPEPSPPTSPTTSPSGAASPTDKPTKAAR